MTPLSKLLRVASNRTVAPEIRQRVMAVCIRLADGQQTMAPTQVTPGVALAQQDPFEVVNEHAEAITEGMFAGKNSKDEAVSAATSLPVAIATILRNIEDIVAVVPEDSGDEDVNAWAVPVKESLEAAHERIQELQNWAEKWKEVANAQLETQAPKFPTMPGNVMPSPEQEGDKLPVVDEEEDEEGKSDKSLDDVMAELSS